jgi:hypothetical protein
MEGGPHNPYAPPVERVTTGPEGFLSLRRLHLAQERSLIAVGNAFCISTIADLLLLGGCTLWWLKGDPSWPVLGALCWALLLLLLRLALGVLARELHPWARRLAQGYAAASLPLLPFFIPSAALALWALHQPGVERTLQPDWAQILASTKGEVRRPQSHGQSILLIFALAMWSYTAAVLLYGALDAPEMDAPGAGSEEPDPGWERR